MADLTDFRVTGTNNSSKQVSVTKWNGLLDELENGSRVINVKSFGAVGDGVTNDYAAVRAALDYAKTNGRVEGAATGTQTIYFPLGNYYMGSNALELHATYHLLGDGRGVATGGIGTKLTWDANTSGIITHQDKTFGLNGLGTTSLGTAAGTILENLWLIGGWASTPTEGNYHAVQFRTPTTARHVFVQNWQGAGFFISASTGSASGAAIPYGNVNGFVLEDCRANDCRDGFWIEGADGNAGRTIGIQASRCRRHGIVDNSFLGNVHINPLTQNICLTAYNDGTASYPASMVYYNGHAYYVRPGQATGAATNAPSGTTVENTWWGYVTSLASAMPASGFPQWVEGINVREGFTHYGPNVNAAALWLYPYREGNSPKANLAESHLVLYGTGFSLDASCSQSIISAASNRLKSNNPLQVVTNGGTLAGWNITLGSSNVDTSNYVLRFPDGTGSASSWEKFISSGDLTYSLGGTSVSVTTGLGTAQQFGTGAAVTRATWFRDLMVGSTATNARRITMSTAAPTTGAHAQGEFVINQIPTRGVFAWVCSTAGTPGTWLPLSGTAHSVSADKGNTNVTIGVGDEYTQYWNTPLTNDRTCGLSTSGAFNGAKFRIVRTAASTGAFNIHVGTGPLKLLATGQWCDVEYNGTAWVLTGFGSL